MFFTFTITSKFIDCKYLIFSDCYGECSKAIKGIVQPDDFCAYGERKEDE